MDTIAYAISTFSTTRAVAFWLNVSKLHQCSGRKMVPRAKPKLAIPEIHAGEVRFLAELVRTIRCRATPLQSRIDIGAGDAGARRDNCARIQERTLVSMLDLDLFRDAPPAIRHLFKRATRSCRSFRICRGGRDQDKGKKG
jgi:hypothetical protein